MPNQSSKNQKNSPPVELAWNLDWNLLRTFMVIVQEKNITAAANRLGLKQPTVSNALKRLEQCLGSELIKRGPRSFEVTAQGKSLYSECTSIFGTVNRLSSALEEADEEISGTVQLSMASHVMCPLLDETLATFHRLHPKACISIDIGSSRDVIRSVLEKKSALGICLVNEQVAELEYQHMYTEHFGFFCGPRHRLFGKTGLRLEDLRGEQCVSFPTDQLNDVLQPVALLRARADFDKNFAGVSSNLEEIRRMVIAGLGVGALPVHAVVREVKDKLLHRLPPYENLPPINIWLVRHPGASLNQAEDEFFRMLAGRIAATPIETRTYGNGNMDIFMETLK
ncbi:MAG: LysR family transcriptional regulator [Lysobacterales bacterium]